MVRRLLADGSGLAKFREWVVAQEGDPRVADDLSLLPAAPIVQYATAGEHGWVSRVDALTVARAATVLGAGRGSAGAFPDLAVGVVLLKKCGDRVRPGERIAEIHAKTEALAIDAVQLVREAFAFSPQSVSAPPLIYGVR